MPDNALLYVEDSADLRGLVREALTELGYALIAAEDGRQALALLERHRFAAVFSDVSMPNGMTGIELMDHARRLQPHAYLILASGYAKAQLPPIPDGIAFLSKPYRVSQLVALLDAAGVEPD